MKEIKIEPFPFVIIVYILFNLIFTIFACLSGEMIIELGVVVVDSEKIIYALFMQWLSLFFIYLIYKFFYKFKLKNVIDNGYSNIFGYFLIFYQIFYMFLAFYYGVGVVGKIDNVSINKFLLILTNIFSVDVLFFIIGSQLKSKKLFIINLSLYLISTLLRGWMGGVLIAVFILICRNSGIVLNIKQISGFIFLTFILIAASPKLVDFKYDIRGDSSMFLEGTPYFEKLNITTQYLFGRFQHVGHIYLIQEKRNFYSQSYDNNLIRPYYSEGFIQGIISRNLGGVKTPTLGEYVVKNAFGGTGWNTNTGLAGWFYVLNGKTVLMLFYWSILLSVVYAIVIKYGTKVLFNVVNVFVVLFLFHGWFGAFFDFIFFVILFTLINRFRV